MNELYGNKDDPHLSKYYPEEATPEQMEGLKKRLDNARQFTGYKYPVKPERKQKVIVNNTTRKKTDEQV